MTNKKRPTRPEEGRAAAIVAAATAGTLHPLDRPPLQNVADYFLQLPGRAAGVLEVTSHGDPDRANLHAQLRKQGLSHLNPRLSKFWSAYLPPMPLHQRGLPVKYADVLSKLPQIEQVLLSLERQERYATGAWEESVEADQLRHLGVSSVLGLNNGEPSINFLPPGDGGGSGPSAVVAAALSEASKPDNQRKLERGPYPERAGGADHEAASRARHLFVWMHPTRMLPFYALADRVLPTQPPALPGPLTDLWVGGDFRSGEVVWHTDGGAWREVPTDKPFRTAQTGGLLSPTRPPTATPMATARLTAIPAIMAVLPSRWAASAARPDTITNCVPILNHLLRRTRPSAPAPVQGPVVGNRAGDSSYRIQSCHPGSAGARP